MALTKITSRTIEPGSISSNSLSQNVVESISSAAAGVSPVIANVQIANSTYGVLDDTAVSLDGGYIILNGNNFGSNTQLVIGDTLASSITVVSNTVIRAQVPAKTAGSYILYLTNQETGSVAIRVNGLTYSGTPTWVTGSTLAEAVIDEAINIQLSATADSNVSYQLQAGSSLPAGLSLAANGLLTGTVTGIEAETTYNFIVEAIDAENQDSPRSFSITITVGDEYFYATTLLLNGDGANGANNNTFVDSSNNNFAITRNGNVTQGTFSPFAAPEGRWSAYFDGTGDYLSNTSAALITQSVSTFTAEGWVYMTAAPTSDASNLSGLMTLDGQPAGTQNYLSFGPLSNRILRLRWFDGAAKAAVGSTTLNLNQWYHVACVVNSNVIQFYVDGVAEIMSGTTTLTNRNGSSAQFALGGNYYGTFSGYLSNARVTTTAVYTSAFTPSTSPLTAITNTSLLTCQSNRFKDNSTNNFAITRNGDVKVTSFSPFAPTDSYSAATNGGSGYFDGTDDYLAAPINNAFAFGTGDFCIECWAFKDTQPNTYETLFSTGLIGTANGGMAIELSNTRGFVLYSDNNVHTSYSFNPIRPFWTHYAFTRSSGTFRFFVDGVAVHTATVTTNFQAGSTAKICGWGNVWTGYLSDFRVVKGNPVYTSNFTPPTAPLTAITNTSLLLNFTNGGIIDYTGKNNLETVGNAQISTSVKKYGTGSLAFDKTDDRLVFEGSENFVFGTGDFTIECWIYANIVTGEPGFLQISDQAGGLKTSYTSGISMGLVTPSAISINVIGTGMNGAANLVTGTWYHVALTRSSGSVRLFLDGVVVSGPTTVAGSINGRFLCVGGYYNTAYLWNGFIDDLRITKGVARYTSNFTPPTSAHRLR